MKMTDRCDCGAECDPEFDDGICPGCQSLFDTCPYSTNEDDGERELSAAARLALSRMFSAQAENCLTELDAVLERVTDRLIEVIYSQVVAA